MKSILGSDRNYIVAKLGFLGLQGNWSNSSVRAIASGTANATHVGVQLDCHLDFVAPESILTIAAAPPCIRAADVTAVLAGVFGLFGFDVFLNCHGNYKEKANVRRNNTKAFTISR